MIQRSDLCNWFSHHPPEGDDVARYEVIRAAGYKFAEVVATVEAREAQGQKTGSAVLLATAHRDFLRAVEPLLPQGVELVRFEEVAGDLFEGLDYEFPEVIYMVRECVAWGAPRGFMSHAGRLRR